MDDMIFNMVSKNYDLEYQLSFYSISDRHIFPVESNLDLFLIGKELLLQVFNQIPVVGFWRRFAQTPRSLDRVRKHDEMYDPPTL